MKKKIIGRDTYAMEAVKTNAERAMKEAFSVLDGIKGGTLPLAQATEMSNALGKANAAMGNIIKAEFLCMAMEKQTLGLTYGSKPREAR